MKIRLLSTFIIACLVGYGQNWNVFNKNYRYNYKYNYSQLISNVLFVDSVKQIGSDTTYVMNNIGVMSGNTVVPNQPQFLMKSVVKMSNGDVKLQNPSTITIVPTCSLSQSWIFDSANNFTATCASISTVNIFNLTDSVRIIIVNNVDSLILSMQFGIIQFPKLYAQNKYYRLVGIERANSYDSIPLFGLKVSNAWDFYRFDVGDKYCLDSRSGGHNSSMQWTGACKFVTRVINSKSITPNIYSYNVSETGRSNNWPYPAIQGCWDFCSYTYTSVNGPIYVPITSGSFVDNYTGLDQPSRIENKMYPGMVVPNQVFMTNSMVEFGLDNNGTFYKYYGPPCQTGGYTALPNATITSGGTSLMFGVGLGKINDFPPGFEYFQSWCIRSFNKINGNITYFGPFYTVGIEEDQLKKDGLVLFPNPATRHLNLPISTGVVRIHDGFGKLVKEENVETGSSIDISALPNGFYVLEIQSDSIKSTQKLIIQH